MWFKSSASVLSVSFCLFAHNDVQSQALRIVSGPEIVNVTGSVITIRAETEPSAKGKITYWTASRADARSEEFEAQKVEHAFNLNRANSEILYRYQITFTDNSGNTVTSPVMSTQAINSTLQSLAEAEFLTAPQIESGSDVVVRVKSANVASLRAEWTGPNQVRGSNTIPLSNGTGTYRFTITPVEAGKTYNVTLSALNGTQVIRQAFSPVTTQEIAPPTVLNITGDPSSVTTEARRVLWRVPFTPASRVVEYNAVLTERRTGFAKTYTGECLSDQCQIELKGLQPGTEYIPTIEARFKGPTPYSRFYAGRELAVVSTSPLPRFASGPKLVFATGGLKLMFTTSAPTDSRLSATFADNSTFSERRLNRVDHEYDLNRPLKFSATSDGSVESALAIQISEPGTDTPIQIIPLSLSAKATQDQRSMDLIERNNQVKEILGKVGPVVGSVVKALFIR